MTVYHGWTPSQQIIDNLKKAQRERDFQHWTAMKAKNAHCGCFICELHDAIDRDMRDEDFTRRIHGELARGR